MNACCNIPTFDKTNTKFIHQRHRHNGYLSGLSAYGGRTIAYSQMGGGRIAYAIAKVHPNDRYVKQIGRAISTAKLNAGTGGIFLGTTEEFFQAMYSATYIYVAPEEVAEASYFTKARA